MIISQRRLVFNGITIIVYSLSSVMAKRLGDSKAVQSFLVDFLVMSLFIIFFTLKSYKWLSKAPIHEDGDHNDLDHVSTKKPNIIIPNIVQMNNGVVNKYDIPMAIAANNSMEITPNMLVPPHTHHQ